MNPAMLLRGEITLRFCRWILLLILALFITRNLPWHLDDLDQAKQAFVSYQMIEEGRWAVQNTPRDEIATKPPLQGWISAALYLALGPNSWELAWRLPVFVSALLVLRQLWRTGAVLHGSVVGGLLAAAAFGLNSYLPRLAALVRNDMLLSALIFFIGWLILEKIRTGEPWTWRSRLGLFALLLASMLAKGPIAYAFLLPGMLAYYFLTRRTAHPRHVFCGWLPWLLPVAFFGGWLALGLQVPEFYDEVIGKEFFGRFKVGEAAVHHNFAPGAYIVWLFTRSLPWSLLLLGIFAAPQVRQAVRRDPALLWLVCWSLGGLIFMEFVPAKRFDRILPVVPPLCLLLAGATKYLPYAWPGRWPFHQTVRVTTLAAALFATIYAGLYVARGFRNHDRALVRFGGDVQALTKPSKGRLAIVHVRDEALVIYCGVKRYTRFEEALERWQRGELEWLVVGDHDYKKRRDLLQPFVVTLESPKAKQKADVYRLLHHLPPLAVPNPAASPTSPDESN